MPKLFFLALLSTLVLKTSAQTAGYFLPKKVLYVTVPFKITEKKLVKVDPNTGKAGDIIDAEANVIVDGEITVEGKMYPGLYKNLNLDLLGRGGKTFDFVMKFDDKGSGNISSINVSQTPVTSDIITGVVTVVGSALKVANTFFGAAGAEGEVKAKEITTEQKFSETRTIEIAQDNTKETEIQIVPSVIVKGGTRIPSVIVKISPPQTDGIKDIEQNSTTLSTGFTLHYRAPAEHSIQVKVLNNQLVKEQTIIDEKILIPQTGKVASVDIPILKGKKTVEIAFSTESGNLTTYSIKKESQLKETLSSTSEGIESLSAEVKSLLTTLEAKKKEEEAKKKEEQEKAVNKDLKDEISSLQLENARLDLMLENQKLAEEIAAKKKELEAKKDTKK